ITFPPDRFYGAELSAMRVPDLLGTQGTFLLFTTRPAAVNFKEGGIRVPVTRQGDRIETSVPGPPNLFVDGPPPLTLPLTLTLDHANRRVRADLDGTAIDLTPGQLSPWVTLAFRAAPGITVTGLTRLLVTEMD